MLVFEWVSEGQSKNVFDFPYKNQSVCVFCCSEQNTAVAKTVKVNWCNTVLLSLHTPKLVQENTMVDGIKNHWEVK